MMRSRGNNDRTIGGAKKASFLYQNWGVKAETFGPAKAFTQKYLKRMDWKRRSWQLCSLLLTILVLVFVFSVSPKHLDIRLPEDEDLLETPLLRGQETTFEASENPFLKERLVAFLRDSCDQLKSYDLLFCHNVVVNEQPFQEPCFMLCSEKTFYANVKVSETDDEDETIVCTERYANTEQRRRRRRHVVLEGLRAVGNEGEAEGGLLLEPFTKIPREGLEICLMQHAVDILKGNWLTSA
tara:strand:+ start:694 stop:1413 length:720 start_codon:yes stop_codon:yes gene_type:complete